MNRLRWRWKRRIRKGTDRDRDHLWFPMRLPIDGRAANRAKVERHRMSAIRHPCKRLRASLRFNIPTSKECRNPIGAPRSLLTCKTMAQGDVRLFSCGGCAQLSAGTRRKSYQSDPSAERNGAYHRRTRRAALVDEGVRQTLDSRIEFAITRSWSWPSHGIHVPRN
jgi:hypothetical protein